MTVLNVGFYRSFLPFYVYRITFNIIIIMVNFTKVYHKLYKFM